MGPRSGKRLPGPDPDDAYAVKYFKRHRDDDPSEEVPGFTFLRDCPATIRRRMFAVVIKVAKTPPPKFAGGGFWEAMHGEMTGWHEIRLTGPGREQFRLFCLLDANPAPPAEHKNVLAIITGMRKPPGQIFSPTDYARVRTLGDEYRSRVPRSSA